MNEMVPPLVDPSWLSTRVLAGEGSAPIRVIDVTWNPHGRPGRDYYQESHIPGSLFFDLEECRLRQSPYRVTLPPAAEFADYVSELGIGNDTHVVVYEHDPVYGSKTATRVWWMFRVFGHDRVSILDGGLGLWIKQGHPTTSEEPPQEPRGVKFRAEFRKNLVKSYEDVLRDLKEGVGQLLDTRPPHWFDGSRQSLWPNLQLGTITGSSHLPFTKLLHEESSTFKSADEIRAIFSAGGIDLFRPLTTTCNVGVTACIVAMGAFLLGREDVAVFDGSWDEFSQRAAPELLNINYYAST
ncbi:thiosulfate sulfurtransferase-like [Diadema antillarum]|uniref:thiosulfate sulfurtransferase-like n=1 Tax=Diadema antillarum TaxID=105358 RepID=UPI003A86AB30